MERATLVRYATLVFRHIQMTCGDISLASGSRTKLDQSSLRHGQQSTCHQTAVGETAILRLAGRWIAVRVSATLPTTETKCNAQAQKLLLRLDFGNALHFVRTLISSSFQ